MTKEQILSISPGKIILFGEHFVVYGSSSLISAIDKTFEITARLIHNQFAKKTIIIRSEMGFEATIVNSKLNNNPKSKYFNIVDNLTKIVNFLTSEEVLFYKNFDKNVDRQNFQLILELNSHLPLGGGLGSSSAFCVALVGVINYFFNLRLDKKSLCDLSIQAEKIINNDTSGADCNICTYGGLGIYNRTYGFSKLDFGINDNFKFLIIDSCIPHDTYKMISIVKRLKENNPTKFENLFYNYESIFESAIFSFKNKNYAQLGNLMNQNHGILKELSLSNPIIDKIVTICNANKSILGTKITGAGGGGCIVSLINTDEYAKLKVLIEKINAMGLKFFISNIDPNGWRIINNYKNL